MIPDKDLDWLNDRNVRKLLAIGLVIAVGLFILSQMLLGSQGAIQLPVESHESVSQRASEKDEIISQTQNESEYAPEKESSLEQSVAEGPAYLNGLPAKAQVQDFKGQANQLVLRSVGDVLVHDRVSYMADTQSDLYQGALADLVSQGINQSFFKPDSVYDFMPMLAYIKPFTEYADVTVANMEIIAAGPDLPVSGYPTFNAPKEILASLKDIGVDILSNTTNHTLDMGSEGAHASISNIQEAGLEYYGSFDSWEDYQRPRIIEKNGIKLGFLAYTYGTNGIPVPAGEEYLVNLIDLPVMVKEIEKLKSQVDAVVVSLQLGGEYDTLPNDEQFMVYQALSDAGVKLILGGHPHCLQPFDWYNGQETLAIYSQASFLTGQRELDNKLGGITEVTFAKDEAGQVKVTAPKFMPIFNLGIEAEKMYQVVPLADWNLYQIPEEQAWWETIAERMVHFVKDVEVVSHLETKFTDEVKDSFR